jgi:hypothetical protein
MALATLADVARYLASPPANLADLQPFLDAATDWVERITGRDWDATGAITQDFFNVRAGAVLRLKDESPTITSVTIFPDVSSDEHFWMLSPTSGLYRLLNRGRLQLLPNSGARFADWWSRVKVVYTPSGAIPTPIREAVAMTAAAMYTSASSGVAVAGGIQSEKLGDYSYSLADPDADASDNVAPAEALALLRPYSAARRVRNS